MIDYRASILPHHKIYVTFIYLFNQSRLMGMLFDQSGVNLAITVRSVLVHSNFIREVRGLCLGWKPSALIKF